MLHVFLLTSVSAPVYHSFPFYPASDDSILYLFACTTHRAIAGLPQPGRGAGAHSGEQRGGIGRPAGAARNGDVRNTGLPAVYLAQLDVATGRRVAFYTLQSTSQSVVIPYDWQWVGDGTVLVAGKSAAAGAPYLQSYLARHDFRGTPLAAAHPAAGLAGGGVSVWAYPNPARGAATVQVSGLRGRGARLELLDALGRRVGQQPVAADGDHAVGLTGLPAGLYVARLVAASGQRLGACKVVVGW